MTGRKQEMEVVRIKGMVGRRCGGLEQPNAQGSFERRKSGFHSGEDRGHAETEDIVTAPRMPHRNF